MKTAQETILGTVSDDTLCELIALIKKATSEGITHGAVMTIVNTFGPKEPKSTKNPWE